MRKLWDKMSRLVSRGVFLSMEMEWFRWNGWVDTLRGNDSRGWNIMLVDFSPFRFRLVEFFTCSFLFSLFLCRGEMEWVE